MCSKETNVLRCLLLISLLMQVSGLVVAVKDMEAHHASSLGQCVTQIESHVEGACTVRGPSGGTPERRRYPRPDKFR